MSYMGHGVPRKDTVSCMGQSRPHKQNTQVGGSRAQTLSGAVDFSKTTDAAHRQRERLSARQRDVPKLSPVQNDVCSLPIFTGCGGYRSTDQVSERRADCLHPAADDSGPSLVMGSRQIPVCGIKRHRERRTPAHADPGNGHAWVGDPLAVVIVIFGLTRERAANVPTSGNRP